MKIGVDYWQTISRDPDLFGAMMQAILDAGGEVHIITAVGDKRAATVQYEIEDLFMPKMPYTEIHVVVFDHPREAPELKLEACKRLGIQMFFDDRRDICEKLNKHGILACNLLRNDNRDYDPEKYKYDTR